MNSGLDERPVDNTKKATRPRNREAIIKSQKYDTRLSRREKGSEGNGVKHYNRINLFHPLWTASAVFNASDSLLPPAVVLSLTDLGAGLLAMCFFLF